MLNVIDMSSHELKPTMFPGMVRFSNHSNNTNIMGEVSASEMRKRICNILEITEEQFKSRTRLREVVTARKLFAYFMKRFTSRSLDRIGMDIGGRDHASVLHYIKCTEDLLETDKEFKQLFRLVEVAVSPKTKYITKDILMDMPTDTVIQLAYNESRPKRMLLRLKSFERGVIDCDIKMYEGQWISTINMIRISIDDFIYFDYKDEDDMEIPMRLFYFDHFNV